MKKCCRCKKVLDFSFFNKSKGRKDGFNPTCTICNKEYRDANRERLLAYKAEYYLINKERMDAESRARYHKDPQKQLKAMREYYSTPANRAKKMLGKIRERALSSGIDFNLEIEDIKIPTHCPYLGMELTHELGKGHVDSNSSLDRIDPSKGYIKGNVQVISLLANQMKNSATKEQLLEFAKNIIRMNQ